MNSKDKDYLVNLWTHLRNNPPARKDQSVLDLALEVADESETMIKDIRQYAAEYLSEHNGDLSQYEMKEGSSTKKWNSWHINKVASRIVEEWQFLDAEGVLRHLINNDLLTPSAALKLFKKKSEYGIEQYMDKEVGKPKLYKKKEI